MKSGIVLVVFAFLLSFYPAFSQEEDIERTVGISATIQGGSLGINLPVWVGEKVIVGPSFSFAYYGSVGADFGAGIFTRFYFNTNRLAPYAGFRGGVMGNIPKNENTFPAENRFDFYGGVSFGGEYFISPQFSFNVEAQLNITKSDEGSFRFGNPDKIGLNTASLVGANIYF